MSFPVSHSTLALAVGVALSLPVHAQRAPEQPGVMVTASRTPVTVDASLASVSVITRADIEASGSNDVHDLLRSLAGLDLVRGGAFGQQTSLFLRGTNSTHVLVLIDGVRVSALGTGGFTWEQLALSQIERIEVVRGPRAALWGSDAIGGVVQVFTRRSDGADAAVSVGNHDSYAVEAGIGRRGERAGASARVGYGRTRGENAQSPDGFAFDPDDDGLVQRNALLQGDLRLGTQVLGLMASLRDNDTEFDQGEYFTRQTQAGLTLEGELAPDWSQHASVAASRDTLDSPAYASIYHSRREQAGWNHTLALGGRNELLLGLAYVREHGRSIDTFLADPVYDARRTNRAALAGWRVGRGAHDLEVSGRHDDNSQFGGQDTWSAAWGWQLSPALRATVSHGEGFRAPTLNELYSPGFGGLFAGNPALDPERSGSFEAGLDWRPRAGTHAGLRAYRNDVDGLIDFSGGDVFQAININRARIDGVELEAGTGFGDCTIEFNATWQDARDRDSGMALLRRPDRKANLLLERRFDGGTRIGVEAHAASSRPELGGDLPGYGLLSLRGSLPLGERLTLDARIENLLDRDYVVVRGYNTAGMTALLTLRWSADAAR